MGTSTSDRVRTTGLSARPRTLAAAAIVLLGAGLGPVALPAAADPGTPAEAVFPAGVRSAPLGDTLYTAGGSGFLHTQEGKGEYLWTDFASGRTEPLTAMTALVNSGLMGFPASKSMSVVDLANGERVVTALPTGRFITGAFTMSEVLTYEKPAGGTITGLHLLRTAEGQVTDVALPSDALPEGYTSIRTVAQDLRGAVLELGGGPSGKRLVLVDYVTGAVTGLFASLAAPPSRIALSADRVLGWFGSAGALNAWVVPRADTAAEPRAVAIPPLEGASFQPVVTLALAGDWIVVARARDPLSSRPGRTLTAIPVGGGEARTLLTYATNQLVTAADGSVLVVGGAGVTDWAVRRVTASGAEPVVTDVLPLHAVNARVDGLALGAGKLSVASDADGSSLRSLYGFDLAPTGAPEPGPRALLFPLHNWYKPCQAGSDCVELHALGNGHIAYADHGDSVNSPRTPNSLASVVLPNTGNRIVDSSGRYTVVDDGTQGKQYVGDFEQHRENNVTLTRTTTAASVWGTGLWKPGPAKGTVDVFDLKTRKTSSAVDVGAGCAPQELQTVGRWVYWSCGPAGKAGVWDRIGKKSIAVPSGDALLGDGFLVRHDRAAGKLLLTDFHGGAGTAAVTGEFADLPAEDGLVSDRRINWTVDKYGGDVAFVDAGNRIHVKRVGVPRSPVTSIEATTDDYSNLLWSPPQNVWHGTWQLSRPPVGWSLTFRNAAGKAVRTIRGTAHEGAQIATTWNGRDDRGAVVPGGRHTWSLAADPGDGSGFRTVSSGAVQLAGAKSAWRDFNGDGTGELVGLTTSGTLRHLGFDLNGGVAMSSSKGWNTGYRFVPFGDLDGDGCADMLVRTTSGALYRYSGRCGGSVSTAGPKLSLGTGFQAFDVLTSPGDLSGDGRPDLVVRKTSTSDVWLYKATSSGRLASRVKLASKWTGYKKIVGAGDLNGDGFGDLLVQDKANVLWRYNGDGKGHLKARVKLASKWGADYNVVAGAGDITADGRMDLLVRDTKNRVWLYKGNGKGAFGARKLLMDGISGYKTLS
ncbi:FG-GAP-like repeat-containing protein [Actinacidiphila glaucinigra]|uniref:FG-GAP-like repeat-containing protein n=1 Tax=Actinacidiphila glaucinigra TaxID=235986 RepID=UPI002E3710B6|nr:FG-GAP-like repeat-containing protein [Actinacidiphila glaucinigra]